MGKMFKVLLMLILVLSLTFAQQQPTKEDYIKNVPKDYDKLLEAYKKMVDFAFQWKALYEQERELNQQLLGKLEVMAAQMEEMNKRIERLEKTVDTLHEIILRLVGGKFGVLGTYNLKDGGFSIGVSYRF